MTQVTPTRACIGFGPGARLESFAGKKAKRLEDELSNVDEIRASLQSANETTRRAIAALAEAINLLEEARAAEMYVIQGSNDQEIIRSSNMKSSLIEQLPNFMMMAEESITVSENYQQRL
ncbi:hypothetical protein [Alkalihalobacillus sp. TS-13]|uniref:hypothetical protein n=1 Tax=Alkalihalobacillus sp. TS-13 TaxID=2842455 RepID=UPI001C887FA1|nr:hypothetical protein [Alkalihalobacillus sp. TS-13]